MNKLHQAYISSFLGREHMSPAFFEAIEDLYNRPEVQGLSIYEQHLDIDRLQHITSVAYISFLTCRRLGLDYRTAARGAILHDLFYYDWREKDSSHRPHGYLHPGFALKNARELTTLSKMEEDIIIKHMWPLTIRPPRYRESFIVSMADKYCATWELILSLIPKQAKSIRKSSAGIWKHKTSLDILAAPRPHIVAAGVRKDGHKRGADDTNVRSLFFLLQRGWMADGIDLLLARQTQMD